jgi:hypothetical protein
MKAARSPFEPFRLFFTPLGAACVAGPTTWSQSPETAEKPFPGF